MDSKLLKISMALCLVSCMSSCDDGEYKNLDCDPATYEPECLAANSYMYCRDGMLTVMECGLKQICREMTTTAEDGSTLKAASCQPIDDVPAQCTTNSDCKDVSKPVCSNGQCVADSAPAVECSSNDDCKDASKPVCSNNVCVANSTPDVDPSGNVGDACDENFVERCDGNAAIYCSSKGVVTSYACTGGSVCLVSGTSIIADCYTSNAADDELVCTNVGEKVASCESHLFYGAINETLQCEELSDGSKRYVSIDLVQCDFACNEAGNGCEISTTDGKTCTGAASVYCTSEEYASCAINDGSVVCYNDSDKCDTLDAKTYSCNSSSYGDYSLGHVCTRMADGKTQVRVLSEETSCDLSCEASSGKCAAVTDDGKTCNAAATAYCTSNEYDGCAIVDGGLACYLNEDKCTTVGNKVNSCDNSWASWGYYSSISAVCTLADDDATKIYVESSSTDCDEICDSATGLCAADTRVEGECSTGEKSVCASYDYAGCELVGGEAMCHEGTCTKENDVTAQCGTYVEGDYTVTQTCVKADNGKLIYDYAEAECNHGCNTDKTACLKLVDDEGADCDDSFKERCAENVVVYCYKEVVTAYSCDAGTDDTAKTGTCYVSETANYADCYTESDLKEEACETGQTKTECDDETDEHAVQYDYACAEFKTADGTKTESLFYVSDAYYCTNDAETAYTTCSEDKKSCSSVEESN